jgi:phage recombination protein Bet
MSQELTTTQPKPVSALAILADRLNVDTEKLMSTLKNTVFKGASNEEMMVLTVVANAYGLNPLVKELYAFPAKGGGIVPVVSIDGWLRITNDHAQMDGMETTFEHDENGMLISCTCSIHRKDRQHPTTATEYLRECKRATEPWKMEHRMLRHKAIIQCARIAFGFSGIHDEDEGADVAASTGRKERNITPAATPLDPFTAPAALPMPPSADMEDMPNLMDEEAAQ